jgi:excisionase family DNA binding protein
MDAQVLSSESRKPLLVTVEEAAARLGGISRRKLYDYLQDGSLRSVYIGRRRLVRLADLERFVDDLQAVA